jgi:hypothetical protein
VDAGGSGVRPVADQLRIGTGTEREALRREMDGLDEVRLACPVRPGCEDEPRLELDVQPRIRPDVMELDP